MAVPAAQTPSGKKWEYFYTYGFSQSQGEAVCVQLGGHLVTVDSNRTNQMLYDKFVAQWPLARDGIWIGLTAQQPTTDRSKWSWLSGAKMSYQNWGVCGGYPPQPDNHAGIQGQCAILSGLQWCNVGKASGTWDDYHCSYGNPFVCEFAPSVTKKTSQAQITGGPAEECWHGWLPHEKPSVLLALRLTTPSCPRAVCAPHTPADFRGRLPHLTYASALM